MIRSIIILAAAMLPLAAQVENLGTNINSPYDELAPVIAPDGQTIYFIRGDSTAGKSKIYKIWYSEFIGNAWHPAKEMPPPFNLKPGVNTVYSVTPDGNTLLVLGSKSDNGFTGGGLSFLQRTKDGWGAPQKVEIKGYDEMQRGDAGMDFDPTSSQKQHIATGFLANDGKTLLLSFYQGEEFGNDLFVSFLSNGTWSRPKDMGDKINTESSEITPFLASDGVTLYFSSDRGGNADIYVAKRLDRTWRRWSTPVKLSPPVNSDAWEAYYSIDAKGEYAYMVSYKNTVGKGDIVRVKLTKENRPDPVVLVTGTAFNGKTKDPIAATIQYEILPGGENAGVARTAPSDGKYKIVLPYGKLYSFRAEAPGYIPVSQNLDLVKVSEYKEVVQDLSLIPIEIGQTIRLNSIFFDYNKKGLREESYPELKRVVDILHDNEKMEIEVSGHTDDKGDATYNMKLSEERANAVKQYLMVHGVNSSRLTAKGYGKTKPSAPNTTEAGRQQNRRVEFTILKN
ncbi:MAG: OmpA family protein [Spirochaetota bacterium]